MHPPCEPVPPPFPRTSPLPYISYKTLSLLPTSCFVPTTRFRLQPAGSAALAGLARPGEAYHTRECCRQSHKNVHTLVFKKGLGGRWAECLQKRTHRPAPPSYAQRGASITHEGPPLQGWFLGWVERSAPPEYYYAPLGQHPATRPTSAAAGVATYLSRHYIK